MATTIEDDIARLGQLGRRLRRQRLDLDITREQLAAAAGLSADTVRNAEHGHNVSLQTLLSILRPLHRLQDFDALLAEPQPNPVEPARRQGKRRQRASGRRKFS